VECTGRGKPRVWTTITWRVVHCGRGDGLLHVFWLSGGWWLIVLRLSPVHLKYCRGVRHCLLRSQGASVAKSARRNGV
jgi:hypothetical protein